MAKKITTIPAIKPMFSSQAMVEGRKRRVAAYARVSTDSDEQFTSFEAQVDYYTRYIANGYLSRFMQMKEFPAQARNTVSGLMK